MRSSDEWKYFTCYAGTERNKEAYTVVGGLARRRTRRRERTKGDDSDNAEACQVARLWKRERVDGGEFDSSKTVRFSRR